MTAGKTPQNISVRNPLAIRRAQHEVAEGRARNLTEAAENALIERSFTTDLVSIRNQPVTDQDARSSGIGHAALA
jgi:hypothetical protein